MLFGILFMACGSSSSATGEFGLINYSLHSDYITDDRSLLEVSLVTGYELYINASLTDAGEEKAASYDGITHSASPSDGVTINGSFASNLDFNILVENGGEYTINSKLDGELFDRIDLNFAEPDDIELISWFRSPNTEEFWKGGNVQEVVHGTQLTFVPVPLANGDRLAGDIKVKVSAEPEDAVVFGSNIYGTYEQNVMYGVDQTNFYFIETGEVNITFTDTENGVSITRSYNVVDME